MTHQQPDRAIVRLERERDALAAQVAAMRAVAEAAQAWAATTHPPEGCAVCEALRAAVGDVSL